MNTVHIKKTLRNSPSKQAGFTLIELMVASVIGLFILGGAITIFSGNSASSSLSSGMIRLQESGRVGIEIITHSVRMADFQGCQSAGKENSVLATRAPTINLGDDGDTGIWGSEYNTGNWAVANWAPHRRADLDAISTDQDEVGAVKPGTDILYVQHGSGLTDYLMTDMAADTVAPEIESNSGRIQAGDLVMISNCQTSDIFRAASIDTGPTGGFAISHPNSSNTQNYLTQPYPVVDQFGDPTLVMKFEATAYFVGNSGRNTPNGGTIYSLFSLDTTTTETNPSPTEMIEGVENFQILYGQRIPTTNNIRYVSAPNVTEWADVEIVQLGMLIATANEVTSSNDTKTYNIAGTSIGPTGVGAHAGDMRLRIPFNTTIQVRNRGLL